MTNPANAAAGIKFNNITRHRRQNRHLFFPTTCCL